MRLENFQLFWILLSVPLVALLLWTSSRRRRRALFNFVDAILLPGLLPGMQVLQRQRLIHALSTVAALLFLSLAVLRPQWGYTWKEGKQSGVDIIIALDVSESMRATDVPPSRLERARRKIIDLLARLRGDRAGLVVFAGVPFLETPLTFDYSTYRSFLESVSTDLIPIQGTNIELALDRALDALEEKSSQERPEDVPAKGRSKAILLITDGEEFEGNIEKAAIRAAQMQVRIFIMGVGSTEGGPIPTREGYKKDKSGHMVITRMRPDALRELAIKTGGIFVNSVSNEADTEALYDDGIKKVLTGTEMGGGREKAWNEYFQVPLFLAFISMILPAFVVALLKTR